MTAKHHIQPVKRPLGQEGLAKRARQKGSAILEAALVFLPMMALAFAIMDYSIGIFVQGVLFHAVRSGVRFAITQQTGAGGQDAAIIQTVQTNAFGFLNGGNQSLISITYYNPKTLTVVNGANSNASGNICTVTVNGFPWNWIAPVWRSSAAFTFSASSADVMESPPGGILPAR
jgi:Flp pilus assembly protein TadG